MQTITNADVRYDIRKLSANPSWSIVHMFNWSFADVGRIQRARSFGELGEIAVQIFAGRGTGVMMSSPLTTGGCGVLAVNMGVLALAVEALEYSDGTIAFSQIPFEEKLAELHAQWRQRQSNQTEYCYELIDGFYGTIFRSGLVAEMKFMPAWPTSKGCVREHEIIQDLGIRRSYIREDFAFRAYEAVQADPDFSPLASCRDEQDITDLLHRLGPIDRS